MKSIMTNSSEKSSGINKARSLSKILRIHLKEVLNLKD